ncbi:hypothetical protein TVAG_063480 [Trichomonas vaginalis G3]|uniref:Raptor N-terminal CASPase-like domain-containing protein n=1 Tax=Trichomonas vaginalis (strain ATCC PRA-98 / G3) TaxID=412133 RepID=A2EU18_TRIV3|nr:TOR signaling [Trichomonas vaginalis G3]EAY03835.1 hypothetical protein TVAG_063480 [Trichomonas vaginalis G3]KAI5487507.1 TOR signaling [Trichomonas vaginalis G3]|eukprot:XP_001316058.1 hypothetical protein [Trichomonas vaginalis G3]
MSSCDESSTSSEIDEHSDTEDSSILDPNLNSEGKSQNKSEISLNIKFKSNYKEELLNLPHIRDEWYNEKYANVSIPQLETLGTIVYMISSRNQIVQQTESLHNKKLIMAWSNIKNMSDTEFPGIIQKFFKAGYKIRNYKPTFYSMLNPTANSVSYLQQFRHDYPTGRAVFHYVGCGFPPISNEGLFIRSELGETKKLISFYDLFSQLKTPSFFIFDCENAGLVIDCFKNVEDKLKGTVHSASNWFCLCATSKNEKIPFDSFIPQDFLSTVLLSPVPIAILSHILKHYNTTFKQSPLDFIQKLVKEKDNDLQNIIENVAEAVSADFLPQSMFSTLFRREIFVRTMFRRFIIAQFLLVNYAVTPVSYPYLPAMYNHNLWQTWEAQVDMWLSKTLNVSPFSFVTFFASFSKSLQSKINYSLSSNKVEKSLLDASLCQTEKGESFVTISQYLCLDKENRTTVSMLIPFQEWFEAFLIMPKKISKSEISVEEFHSFLFIILTCLHTSINVLTGIGWKNDLSNLINLTVDNKYPEQTRSLCCCVVSSLFSHFRFARQVVKEKKIIQKIESCLLASSPIMTLWLLLMIKRAFSFLSLNKSNPKFQFIVNELTKSASEEVRSAAVSCLALFCDERNLLPIYSSIYCLFDCSYLVRMQYLLLAIRATASFPQKTFNFDQKIEFNNFKDIEKYFLKMDEIDDVYEISSKIENKKIQLDFIPFIIEYFCKDPDKRVSGLAKTTKEQFISGTEKIAIPFGIKEGEVDDFTIVELEKNIDKYKIPSDSFNLFKSATEQLISGKMWKIIEPEADIEQKESDPVFILTTGTFVQVAHSTLQGKVPVKLCYFKDNICVGCSDGSVQILGDDHEIKSNFVATNNSLITDMVCVDDSLVVCSSDGSVSVWPENAKKKPFYKFRASGNYLNDDPLYCSNNKFKRNSIATCRGTEICFWDLIKLKLTNEFSFNEKSSAINYSFNSENILYVGGSNGTISTFDIRSGLISSIKMESEVINISTAIGESDVYYTAHSNGQMFRIGVTSGKFEEISGGKGPLNDFSLHPSNKIMASCPIDSEPFVFSTKGQMMYRMPVMQNSVIAAMHQKTPIMTFANKQGEIHSFQMI